MPIVWLDADATLEADPVLFRTLDADFGVHKWSGTEFGSGTLFFGKSDITGALLDRWVLRCEADPLTWDQVHLQSAWCDISSKAPLRTVFLPRSYLQIFDAEMREPPIVKHWQASRQEKRRGNAAAPPSNLEKEGIDARLNNKLWRTSQELFWIEHGVNDIVPRRSSDNPEGFDVASCLYRVIGKDMPVLEVGCGIGRLAAMFDPKSYLGVDVNPTALLKARASLPNHTFRITDTGYVLPAAPAALIYTVALHVPDDRIRPFLRRLSTGRRRVVICELMDRRWRRAGDPPVFNREPEDYILMMHEYGFRLLGFEKHSYGQYKGKTPEGADHRITFLSFAADGT